MSEKRPIYYTRLWGIHFIPTGCAGWFFLVAFIAMTLGAIGLTKLVTRQPGPVVTLPEIAVAAVGVILTLRFMWRHSE